MEKRPRAIQPLPWLRVALKRRPRTTGCNLDRRFTESELPGLRIYRIRWNGNYLVEATFAEDSPERRIDDARALLGDPARPYTPTTSPTTNGPPSDKGLPGWMSRFLG